MINPFLVMKEVEQRYYLKSGVLIKSDRKPRVSEARAVSMYLLRNLCKLSYHEVAEYLERDHSTVITACKKIEKIVQNNTQIDALNVTMSLLQQFKEVI